MLQAAGSIAIVQEALERAGTRRQQSRRFAPLQQAAACIATRLASDEPCDRDDQQGSQHGRQIWRHRCHLRSPAPAGLSFSAGTTRCQRQVRLFVLGGQAMPAAIAATLVANNATATTPLW